VRLDLGGIAKGWASDRICAGLAQKGSCIVNLGGDIALHVASGDEPWPVGVDMGGGETISIAVQQGGLATSGQDKRTWHAAGNSAPAHHLIDPQTSAPAVTDIKRVTVFHDSCMQAEIWAKALLLVGRAAAQAEANSRGLTTIIVDVADRSYRTGSLAE